MIEMAMIDSDVSVWSVSCIWQHELLRFAAPSSLAPALNVIPGKSQTLGRCKIDGVNQVRSSSWRVINNDCVVHCSLPRHRSTDNLGIALKCDSLGNIQRSRIPERSTGKGDCIAILGLVIMYPLYAPSGVIVPCLRSELTAKQLPNS